MLRKIALFSLPLFVLFGMVTSALALEQRRSPDWQQSFDRYLALTRPAEMEMVVLVSSRATMPWNFSAEMGSAFVEPNSWPWNIDQLPYPPDALYCLWVERRPTSTENGVEPAHRLLYVAHHTDALWRVGWVVHESPGEVGMAASNDLAKVGCNFAAPVE